MADMMMHPHASNNHTDENGRLSSNRQPATPEEIQMWINNLKQWTEIFYNQPNSPLWQDVQQNLVKFQRIHDPVDVCSRVIKETRDPLILYQATLCLKNAIANDHKKFDSADLFKLFQFLYEFLCTYSLENEMSVNETTALICAMILKRIASEKSRNQYAVTCLASPNGQQQINQVEDVDRIAQVVTTLCDHVKEQSDNISKKVAASMMLSALLLECQMTNRSTQMGIRVWKHLNARKQFEAHLKQITESCLATIDWAFRSNLLNPMHQTRETQILFHLVGSLIQCLEYTLAFNSTDSANLVGGDRVLRTIQSRTINMLSQANENDQRLKTLREWCRMVMTPPVVQFLFNLYTTIKSMINVVPGWSWPANTLKSALNCLYYLSDVHNVINIERDAAYADFVGNLMIGSTKIMDADTQGIDDSFQTACLITSISMYTGETRDIISKMKSEHLMPFLDSAQRFTCKVFTQVATTSRTDIEEEEEKTVDALLDFWYHLLKNLMSDIKMATSMDPPTEPKVSRNALQAYSRVIVESYISCHLHKPQGQLEPKSSGANEVDLDQAEEQDDSTLHQNQLISLGMIARFDTIHTANLLIELLRTRLNHYESLLTQFINTTPSPDGMTDWEYTNDDLHWLLLILQHFLTQTGYGEVGFMCNEILNASLSYSADREKTLAAFEKVDYETADVDPIVRLIILGLKLCQIEMNICQSGKVLWLSVQTNSTLTTMLSKFCLTYLYPRESDYAVISENMNYCFGQDAPMANKFLRFVIEHACCIILSMKSDPYVVKKNIALLFQLQVFHANVKTFMAHAEQGSITQMFVEQMRPENFGGLSPQVAKLALKLAARLFGAEEDWGTLIDFFNEKWAFILNHIRTGQHRSEMISSKFLEFCDFAIGVCEACDDETSERLFTKLLVPIVVTLPDVLRTFNNFENVTIAIFDLLYHIVRLPMTNINNWDCPTTKLFYDSCSKTVDAYSVSPLAKKVRGDDEEDCEDIIALLQFAHEVMKKDWGNQMALCDTVVKHTMEKLSTIIKREYLAFPRIRAIYYRLMVYLVDEDDRLIHLSDTLMETIVKSILVALESRFDKDVDNHAFTIISIIGRQIYLEQGSQISHRLSTFMLPVLPAVFKAAIHQGSYTLNPETAEMIAPAFFSLRCCFMALYQSLVRDLIQAQDDEFSRTKVNQLFDNLEAKIHKFPLNRASCREFNSLFIPFLAELNNYITTK